MNVYQVWYNNGESYEDNFEYEGGIYTTKEEAEKEILHGNYFIPNTKENRWEHEEYVVNPYEWARLRNEEDDYTPNNKHAYKAEQCDDYRHAYIKTYTLLECFIPEREVAE